LPAPVRTMTLKRVRRYALLTSLALWAVFIIDYATPGPLDRFGKVKGTDFVQFYASGTLVRDGHIDRLYDPTALLSAIRAAVPRAREVYVPIQSPQIALVFAPLAALPYTFALAIWLVAIIGLYTAACVILWSRCSDLPRYRREVTICAVSFPGLYATVIHGQSSVLALLAVAVALLALERHRGWLAGLMLGCLVFKPHWVVALGVVFVMAREWTVLAGICVSALAQLGATLLAVGPKVFRAYLTTLASVGRLGDLLEPRPGYSLRSFFSVFAVDPRVAFVCYGVASVFVVVIAARIWRSTAGFDVRASALVLAVVLVSPHVFEYDLIVLAPVFFFLGNAAAGHRSTGLTDGAWSWSVAALFFAPVLTAVPPPIRLQCSVTAMAAMLIRLWQAGNLERSGNERELGGAADASRQAEQRAADGPGPSGDVHVIVPRRVEL
jgi:alpha-1,2-mannosyltransferase